MMVNWLKWSKLFKICIHYSKQTFSVSLYYDQFYLKNECVEKSLRLKFLLFRLNYISNKQNNFCTRRKDKLFLVVNQIIVKQIPHHAVWFCLRSHERSLGGIHSSLNASGSIARSCSCNKRDVNILHFSH